MCNYGQNSIWTKKQLVEQLLDLNTLEGWKSISQINECNNINNILLDDINKITELVFEIDITKLRSDLYVAILCKFKKIDMLNEFVKNKCYKTLDYRIRIDIEKFIGDENNKLQNILAKK